MNGSRRRWIAWLAGISLIVVAATAIFARQQIVERWSIYRLDSEDAETVDHAATRLAAMGSTRAIVPLIEQIPGEIAMGRDIVRYPGRVHGMDYWTDSAVMKAIHDLAGSPKGPMEQGAAKSLEGLRIPPGQSDHVLIDLIEALQKDGTIHYSRERPVQQPVDLFLLKRLRRRTLTVSN